MCYINPEITLTAGFAPKYTCVHVKKKKKKRSQNIVFLFLYMSCFAGLCLPDCTTRLEDCFNLCLCVFSVCVSSQCPHETSRSWSVFFLYIIVVPVSPPPPPAERSDPPPKWCFLPPVCCVHIHKPVCVCVWTRKCVLFLLCVCDCHLSVCGRLSVTAGVSGLWRIKKTQLCVCVGGFVVVDYGSWSACVYDVLIWG